MKKKLILLALVATSLFGCLGEATGATAVYVKGFTSQTYWPVSSVSGTITLSISPSVSGTVRLDPIICCSDSSINNYCNFKCENSLCAAWLVRNSH